MSILSGRWITWVLHFPACSGSAWCRDPARPSSTFLRCSSTLQRSAKVNAANVFRYPDYSENTVNINQIERKSFKIAANNLDGYKRRQIWAPDLQNCMPTLPLQIGGTVFILKCPPMLVLLTPPFSALRQLARLCLCPGIQASLGLASGCTWVLGSPTFPAGVKGWNPLEIRAGGIFTSLGPGHNPALCFTAFTTVKIGM